jgi:putative ABC transport system permease protein
MRLAEIENVSFSFNSASAESNMMSELSYQNKGGEEIKIRTQLKLADANFIPTYGIKLLAGTNLPDVDSTRQIIINEVFLKRMGIDDTQAALGEIIKNGKEHLQIVGVAADFHVNSLHQKIDPTIIGINPSYFFQANIKLASSEASLKKALAHIEQVWRAAFPEEIYTYQLLDETLNEAYRQETRAFYLLNIFSVITLLVSCLGIYGLISFIALQRTKEIGVRKVLGASVPQIVGLLSKDFVKLILLAFIIASPIAWYTMNRWLEDFEYRIMIGAGVFLVAGGVAIAIAMLTISFQAIKAALANPVKTLRAE